MLSLRDTITGLKQAGDVEGRLKADLVQTHEHLATCRAAQVSHATIVRIKPLHVGLNPQTLNIAKMPLYSGLDSRQTEPQHVCY